MRAFWSGEIAFGLVTIPAKLYSATKDLTPQFHQLHTECKSRIQMVRRCPKCQRDVGWDEIGKGFEVSKGEYALFSKEELAKLGEGGDGESSGGSGSAIEIVEFFDPLAVDPAYFDKSYWVGPGGKSTRGFELLRDVLVSTKKVALAKVKIRTRTRLAILRPRQTLFALDMMRFADELVQPTEIQLGASKPAQAREVELARKLVDELSGEFDPSKHPDEYRAALEAAVDAKIAEGETVKDESTAEEQAVAAPPAAGNVIDLTELLARSLKVAPKPGPKKAEGKAADEPEAPAEDEAPAAEAKKPGPKKAAAKSESSRKRGTG